MSTYMVSEHDNCQDQKEFFLKGYNEMLRRIEPEKIICYNTPFPEMQGDIVFVDYELSSWRYMGDDPYTPSIYAKYICGEAPLPAGGNLIIKSGYVVSENDEYYNNIIQTGMGSAYGGKWFPKKEEDKRLWGKPGEIKRVTIYGYRVDVKIGEDGRAVKERHYTDHDQSWAHTNPHDHIIRWDGKRGSPIFVKPAINYKPEDFPNGAPEFKEFVRRYVMTETYDTLKSSPEEYKFHTISEFKWCLQDGGEVEFSFHSKIYTITQPKNGISISEANKQETEKICSDADEVMEYLVDGIRLRDIITQINVLARTI